MKQKIQYVCTECGHHTLKWMGKCPECGAWNSFEEEVLEKKKTAKKKANHNKAVGLEEIDEQHFTRIPTGNTEFDRVLGGGITPGAMILLGGDPGIGKSTILLESANNVAASGKKVLYVSGEESLQQLKMRAKRMNVEAENLLMLSETEIDAVESIIEETSPELVIIDSIQTMYSPEIASTAGSVSQIRENTSTLMKIAKNNDIAMVLVGHVTKEGNLAGPRVLEHIVDTVLYFEGERHHPYRILRAVKNRFGATNEIGLFEMAEEGLVQVKDPSSLMLASRPENTAGSVIAPAIEGLRPLLLELQGLVSDTSYGVARRMATGFDYNRMILLIAIMEKRLGLSLKEMDCYSNIVGGIRSDEPALDLALITALYSSYRNIEIPPDLFVFGEVGLTGEVREVQFARKRVQEGAKLGFKRCILPKGNMHEFERNRPDIEFFPVDNIAQAMSIIA